MARKGRTDMPENYYSDGDGDPSDSPSDSQDTGDEQSNDTGTTAVVPSELCPGMKVGDEMMVKIVGVDDDSYEISYVSKEEGADESGESATASAPAPDGSMAAMME